MELTEEQLKVIQDGVKKSVDVLLEETLKTVVGKEVAASAHKIVEELRMERMVYGYDRTGVKSEDKKEFAKIVKAAAFGKKSGEELISEVDSRGGYLIPTEVAKGIERIARTSGLVMSKIKTWPMVSDELEVPAYTGSILEGDYLGVNAAGDITAVTFKMAKLSIKKWQLAFALGNDLLQDAPEDLADWLMALAGEALANKVDKMVLAGTGNPFTGILNSSDVTAVTLDSGKDTFQEYSVIDDSSTVIGALEESLLDDACFVFSKTVWANLRTQKDDAGNYLLSLGGNSPINTWLLKNDPKSASGPRPVGEILGFPVYTSRHMPALSASAASTKFGIFGNFACAAYGSRDQMRLEKYQSGTFGAKEIALADQTGLVFKQRHAVALTLPEGFLTIATHS